MEVSVGEVVKRAVVIPAVSKVAQMRSIVPDDAVHRMEDLLGTFGRIEAAAHGRLGPNPFMDPRSAKGKRKRRLSFPTDTSSEEGSKRGLRSGDYMRTP